MENFSTYFIYLTITNILCSLALIAALLINRASNLQVVKSVTEFERLMDELMSLTKPKNK